MPDDITTSADLDALLGTMPTGSPPASTPPSPAPEPPKQPEPTPPEPSKPAEPPAAAPAPIPESKQNAAFAEMRVKNKQYQEALAKAAEIAGLDKTTDPDKVIAGLQQKYLEAQAAKQNVPVEILQRLEAAEQKAQAFEQARLQQETLTAFNKVKDEHGLTNDEVLAFANQLDERGVHPFETPGLDLSGLYRSMNFDKLVQKAVDAAVQKALGTQQAAANHSTKPGTNVGPAAQPGTDQQINTAKGLDDLFRQAGL